MKGDMICINGKMVSWGDPSLDPARLLGRDFVYQKMHTSAHRPLNREMHLEILETSCQTLYGVATGISRDILTEECARVLEGNRYPKGSNLVSLYLLPPSGESAGPLRILLCERQLLYKGYALWHDSMKAIAAPYEYPFSQHKTATSLTAHSYAENYARRKGADVAIAVNYADVVTGVGENPLFAVKGNEALTTPVEHGVAESVERRLGLAACESAGLIMLQQAVEAPRLKDFDELFYVTPQGVVSIGSFAGKLYPNSMAKQVALKMNGALG